MEQSERDLLQNFITAATKGIDEPTPDNVAAADALWDQLAERWKQLPPVDRNEMNRVAEWLDALESGEINAPDELIQAAIIAAKRYLNDPSEGHKSLVDKVWNEVITQAANDASQNPKADTLLMDVFAVAKSGFLEGLPAKVLAIQRFDRRIAKPLMKQLSERQQKIFTLISNGQSAIQIASALKISLTEINSDLDIIEEKYQSLLR